MALPEIVIGSKLDAKGFKQAESAVSKLTKSVRNLAAAFGVAFGARALLNYSKQAVKAFAADENAARSLGLTLKNLNLDYLGASQAVNLYISDLERQTGVLDDELRPAMDRFLRATSSIIESQKLLSLALDISAGTGKDLTVVSQGLQKAFLGNNASLGRLGVGLTKAELTTSTFLQIQERLTELFAGQAKSAADGYLGSINKLTIASNNAKEIIGKDLIDSLALLSGPGGISKSTTQMEDLARAIGDTVYGLAQLINKVKSIPGANAILGTFGDVLTNLQPFAGLRNLGRSSKATPAQSPGERKQIDKINKDALKFQKQQNDLAKIDISNTTRKLVLTADQQALEELKKKFDIDRIQINAALNGSIDKETELRLKSLLAIHDNDAALAGKIMAEIAATDAIKNLGDAARSAALLLQTSYSAGLSSFQQSEINSLTQGPAAPGIPNVLTQPMPSVPMSPLESFRQSEARYAGTGGVSIQINPAVAGLIDVIQNQSASGISPTVNRVSSSYIA